MTWRTHTAKTGGIRTDTPRRRGGLAARLGLIVLGLVLMGFATFTGINAIGSHLSAQAASTLSSNLRSATSNNVDLSTLLALQKRNDSRFANTLKLSPALLPSVREPAEKNASTSRRLTKLIEKELASSKSSSTTSLSASQSAPSPSSSSSSTPSSSQNLTDEQRKKIKEMLASQSSASPSASSTSSSTSSPTGSSASSVRPW